MAQTIRFHLDEHCSTALAEALQRRGIDVTTAAGAGLLQATDEEHLRFAAREQRVVFTQMKTSLCSMRRAFRTQGLPIVIKRREVSATSSGGSC
jgi:predicted nuclease of predicted toxin-antitoxin system